MVAADARTAITFALSPGNAHDAPEGRELLRDLGPMPEGLPILMDRAYEGDETRQLVLSLGMTRSFHPSPTASIPGSTIAHSTKNAMRSNGSSEGSKASGESSPASKNSTYSSSASSTSLSSSKLYASVNTP
jgi:Transposase DDE domain